MNDYNKSYSDHCIEDGFIRTFKHDILQEELVWHRDHMSRLVEVLAGDNWKIQYDNHLPMNIKSGDKFSIRANDYHRLIRGDTPLKIKIWDLIN